MKKMLIIIVSCIIILVIGSYVFMYELTVQGLVDVDEKDVQYLQTLDFEQKGFGYDVEFASDRFEDLRVVINGSSIRGYEPIGQRYGDYVVSGMFFMDDSGIGYTFDVFPYIIEEDPAYATYRLYTTSKLSKRDQLWTDDQELIDIYNRFIDRVEPIVNHEYLTYFGEDDDYGLLVETEIISNCPVIGEVEEYKQIKCDDYDSAYIKDNFLFEKRNDNLSVSYYNLDQNQRVLRYETEEGIEYDLLDDNELSQEVSLTSTKQELEFIKDDINSKVFDLIDFVDAEYNEAKNVLI